MCESVQCQHTGSQSKQVKVYNVNTLGVTQQTGSVCEMLSFNLLGHPLETGGVCEHTVLTYWVIHQRQVVCVNVFSVNLLGQPSETGGDWRNAQSQT